MTTINIILGLIAYKLLITPNEKIGYSIINFLGKFFPEKEVNKLSM